MAKGRGHAWQKGGHAWQGGVWQGGGMHAREAGMPGKWGVRAGETATETAVFILLECILVFKNDQLLLSIVSMNNGQNGSSPTLSVIQPVTIDTMLNNNGPSFSKVMCNQGLSRSGKKRHRTFIFTLTIHG